MKPFFNATKANLLILAAIIFLGGMLRFYRLNHVPLGLYWDEAAITYNAWGIAVWNRDEWGNKLPLSFRSFGDYKSPLYIYLLGSTYKLTGLNIDLVRIYPAIFGIINILLIYLIARALKPGQRSFALLAALFMAVTPWAVHFSRIGVEAQFALMLILAGIAAGLHSRRQPRLLILSAICFGLGLYAYHSAKVFIPVFIIFFIGYLKLLGSKLPRPIWIPAVITLIALSIPLAKDTFIDSGFERGKSLILFQHDRPATVTSVLGSFAHNLAAYLDTSFWVEGYDVVGLRHSVPGHGVLYISIFPLLLIGIIRSLHTRQSCDLLLLSWFGLGLLPALLSQGNPHAIRSLLALPPALLLAAAGFVWLYRRAVSLSSSFKSIFPLALLSIIILELCLYLRTYYGTYAIDSATAFQYGYRQAIAAATQLSRSDETIIITDTYGQPYIYTLLYRRITPEAYKFGALSKFEFSSIDWPKDQSQNCIYLASPQEISPHDPNVVDIILIPGTNIPVFVIAKT